MTNPNTLLLSIAATACGFILALVGIAGPAPLAPPPAVSAATVSMLVAAGIAMKQR
jgi:hypothetical protein